MKVRSLTAWGASMKANVVCLTINKVPYFRINDGLILQRDLAVMGGESIKTSAEDIENIKKQLWIMLKTLRRWREGIDRVS
ncbi:MAG: hypothetical protein J7L34_03015 [Thermotogaceae bacterium]|nr:hypothetical protein [Thermotogaceae bacterium]